MKKSGREVYKPSTNQDINIVKGLQNYLKDLKNYLTTYQGFKIRLVTLKILGKY